MGIRRKDALFGSPGSDFLLLRILHAGVSLCCGRKGGGLLLRMGWAGMTYSARAIRYHICLSVCFSCLFVKACQPA